MEKHLKVFTWILVTALLFTMICAGAETGGIPDRQGLDNLINSGNSTNSTVITTYYSWQSGLGINCTGTSSVYSETVDLVTSDKVEIDNRMAVQLYDGPEPTGMDQYTKKLNTNGYLVTLDLNGDGAADVGMTREENDYYLVRLAGRTNPKDSYTFTYPAPSDEDMVFYNPITINISEAPPAEVIPEAAVTIKPPEAQTGSKAAKPAITVPDGAKYTVEACCWNQADGSHAELSDLKEYTFENGKSYKCWVTLAAGQGYAFSDDTRLTVNGGKLVTIDDVYTSSTYSALVATISVTITAGEWKISFNANGGTGTMNEMTAEKGKAVKLPKNQFTKKNGMFKCWNTAADGSGAGYLDEAEIIPTGDTVLYAQWTPVSLKLSKISVKQNKDTVLTVTLKIDGKAVKGRKVTVTFNGKKYTAKTDKKGVAKVKVKKKVTKKLTVGKKITVTATFGGVTVTKKVKVKKP